MNIGPEETGIIKSLATNRLPGFLVQDLCVKLKTPDDIELLAPGIIVDTGKADDGISWSSAVGFNILYEIGTGTNTDNLTGLRNYSLRYNLTLLSIHSAQRSTLSNLFYNHFFPFILMLPDK